MPWVTIASAVALRLSRPWPVLGRVGVLAPLLLARALPGVAGAPLSRTHGWVTRLALAGSGRAQAHQRWQMQREYQPALAARRQAEAETAAAAAAATPAAPGSSSVPASLQTR